MILLEASVIIGGNAITLAQQSLNSAKKEIYKNNNDINSKQVLIEKWRQFWQINPLHTVSIHGAMKQQIILVSKTKCIVPTVQSRCTVIAATNTICG